MNGSQVVPSSSGSSLWTPTAWAAWVGAIVSVSTLAWNIIRSRGERLIVHVYSGQQEVSRKSAYDKPELADFLFVEVCNRGKPTTLTHLVVLPCFTLWQALTKSVPYEIVEFPCVSEPLPHTLDTGKRWVGNIERSQAVNRELAEKRVYIGVRHSGSSRPALVRVPKDIPQLPPQS